MVVPHLFSLVMLRIMSCLSAAAPRLNWPISTSWITSRVPSGSFLSADKKISKFCGVYFVYCGAWSEKYCSTTTYQLFYLNHPKADRKMDLSFRKFSSCEPCPNPFLVVTVHVLDHLVRTTPYFNRFGLFRRRIPLIFALPTWKQLEIGERRRSIFRSAFGWLKKNNCYVLLR